MYVVHLHIGNSFCSQGYYRRWPRLTDLATHMHCQNLALKPSTLSPVCSSCLEPHTRNVSPVFLMSFTAETQQNIHKYHYTYSSSWRWLIYSTCGLTGAVLFKVCWLSLLCVMRHWRERSLLCFWGGVGECFCFEFCHWAEDRLIIYQPHSRCSSCCTQLYYRNYGHVVHCKILYIKCLLLNVF